MDELDNMSVAELESLQRRIDGTLKVRRRKQQDEAMERIKALAAEAGLEVSVKPAGTGAGKGASVAPKYRHPNDASLTWSGRGRAPRWLAELEAEGAKREAFAV